MAMERQPDGVPDYGEDIQVPLPIELPLWLVRIQMRDPDRAARIWQRYRRERDPVWRRRQEEKRHEADLRAEVDRDLMLRCPFRAEDVRGYKGTDAVLVRRCFVCGHSLPAKRTVWCTDGCRDLWYDNHKWSYASSRALKRDAHTCQACGKKTKALEVNHMNPLVGRGYHDSCRHHLVGLQSLCHDCHVEVTTEQRRSRRDRIDREQLKLALA